MQNVAKPVKLGVKEGRYVCPVCKQRTSQKSFEITNAENLLLWCKQCKSEHFVNIVHGQCYVVSRYR